MFQTQDLPDSGFKPIRFTINLIPKAQMRSRSKAIPMKNKATGAPIFKNGRPLYTAMNHKAPEQEQHELMMMEILERHAPETPWDCAIILGIKAYLPIPASKPSWWKDAAVAGFIRPTPKPDWDNLQKMLKDCLTQTSFWRDDSQVVGLTNDSGKYYAERPRWDITIIPLWQPQSKKEWEQFTATLPIKTIASVLTTANLSPSKYIATTEGDLFS